MNNFDVGQDPTFSRIRATDLHPEAVVSREIRDGLAKIDESTPNQGLKAIKLLLGMVTTTVIGTFELEKQIIDLRRELRERR